MTATLTEIGALAWTRPHPFADSLTVAAWYEDKAALLRAVGMSDEAAQAHAHAVQLLAGSTSGGGRR